MQTSYVAEALYEKAEALYFEKKYPETLQTLQQVLEISQPEKQPPLHAKVYLLMAKTNLAMVHYSYTRKICYQGIKFSKQHRHYTELAELYLTLGRVYSLKSQYDKAIQVYLDSLSIIPIHGNSYTGDLLRAQLHQALGQVAQEIQKTDLQKEHFLKSLFIARRLGHQLLEAKATLGLGVCFFQQQKLTMARTTLLKARQLFQRADDARGTAMTLYHLGWTYTKSIEYRRAVNTFRAAFTIFEEIGDPIYQASSLVQLAQIFLKIDTSMTQRLCQEATELLVAHPSIQSKRQSEIILGRIFIVMGQYYQQIKELDLAINSLNDGLEIFEIHHCQLEYNEALPLYQTLKTAKPPVQPKKSTVLAFKLGIRSKEPAL